MDIFWGCKKFKYLFGVLDIPDIFWQTVDAGSKIVSEYDQEIPQSQTADNPVAP